MTRYQFLVDINYKVIIEGSKLKNMKGKFFWLFNCEMTLSLKPSVSKLFAVSKLIDCSIKKLFYALFKV